MTGSSHADMPGAEWDSTMTTAPAKWGAGSGDGVEEPTAMPTVTGATGRTETTATQAVGTEHGGGGDGELQ